MFHFQNHFPLVTSWEWFSGEITCAVDSRNILRGRTYSVVPRQLPEVRGERSETSVMASHLWVSSGCLGRGAPESSQEEPWLMQVRPVLCHRSPETQQLCYPEDHTRDTAQNMFYHHIYTVLSRGAHTSIHTPNFVVLLKSSVQLPTLNFCCLSCVLTQDNVVPGGQTQLNFTN